MKQETESEQIGLDAVKKFSALGSEIINLNESIGYAENEIACAREKFNALQTSVDQVIGRNVELERLLVDAKIAFDMLNRQNVDLQEKVADAQRQAELWRLALDAARNDKSIYRRLAFWFAIMTLVAAAGAAF